MVIPRPPVYVVVPAPSPTIVPLAVIMPESVSIVIQSVVHVLQTSSFRTGDPAVRCCSIFILPDLPPFLPQRLPFMSVEFSASVPMTIPTFCPGGSPTGNRNEYDHEKNFITIFNHCSTSRLFYVVGAAFNILDASVQKRFTTAAIFFGRRPRVTPRVRG
jgi:hypothetical protein